MRNLKYLLAICFTIVLASCVDTTEDVTLKEDGSGVMVYTMDMSNVLSMMGQMAGGNQTDKLKDQDTTVAVSSFIDSVKDLSAQEKQLLRPGKIKMLLKNKDEKFLATLTVPFKKSDDLKVIKQALPKAVGGAMQNMMSDKKGGEMDMPAGMSADDMPKPKNFDDFFDMNFTSHSITKQLNKESYATVESDKTMQAIQQMNSMGAPMTINYVLNLPRPAKTTEGKLKLSADKKKVTLVVTSEDFFDDPKKFEFKIEY
jgi:hypothetical protein